MQKAMTILGIESSCDDTAASIILLKLKNDIKETTCVNKILSGKILSSEILSQSNLHEKYGGVVPEVAARAHAENLDVSVKLSLEKAKMPISKIDLICVTSGPGLIGGLISGVMFATGLSKSTNKPLVSVNHLAGHALSPRLSEYTLNNPELDFPYLVLLASGGHCQFLEVLGPSKFVRLGGTIDDSPGEAFDKVSRLLGLGYPGGPIIEKYAKRGQSKNFSFPRPLFNDNTCNMSFSGLKSAVAREVEKSWDNYNANYKDQFVCDISASFQKTVSDIFEHKAHIAMTLFKKRYKKHTNKLKFCLCGGVAANLTIRKSLETVSDSLGFNFIAPPLNLCTDNGAMIAFAGAEIFLENRLKPNNLTIRSRWPLDTSSAPLVGSGKRGPKS